MIAAIVAAAMSLITAVLTIFSNRSSEVRAANRTIILLEFKELGKAIHETLALSNLQLKVLNEATHPAAYQKAEDAAKKLKVLRHKVRYSLWGLDNGLRELSRIPDWIGHAKKSPNSAKKLHHLAHLLGQALDNAIRTSYENGAQPGFRCRMKVNRRTSKLRKYYEQFSKLK